MDRKSFGLRQAFEKNEGPLTFLLRRYWLLISDQPDKTPLNEQEEVSNEERVRYLKALEATKYPGTGRWNLNAAARELNMPRKTLTYRLKKLKLIS